MNICIFGDSITWGAGDPIHGGWASLLQNYFQSQDRRIDVYNLGVSGDTTRDLLSRVETEAKARKAECIIFAIGVNDARRYLPKKKQEMTLCEFRSNLDTLLSTAKTFTDKIVFIGITPVDESKTECIYDNLRYANKDIRYFDEAIKKLCRKNHLKYIPMNDLLCDEDFDDGLHPNTRGHKKIFDRISKEMEKIM